MDKVKKGILLTEDMELAMNIVRDSSGKITSGMVVGKCIDQEAFMVMTMNPGDLKEDPILGPGLNKYIRGKFSQSEIDLKLKQHFERAGLDYDDYKERIQMTINKG